MNNPIPNYLQILLNRFEFLTLKVKLLVILFLLLLLSLLIYTHNHFAGKKFIRCLADSDYLNFSLILKESFKKTFNKNREL